VVTERASERNVYLKIKLNLTNNAHDAYLTLNALKSFFIIFEAKMKIILVKKNYIYLSSKK